MRLPRTAAMIPAFFSIRQLAEFRSSIQERKHDHGVRRQRRIRWPEKILQVAKYQRWVLLALLANITLIGVFVSIATGFVVLPDAGLTPIRLIAFGVAIFMTFAAFMLAKQFFHVAIAVVCALLMWIPFVSLIVLLIINQKATRYLQENGIRVGLLGASPSDVRS